MTIEEKLARARKKEEQYEHRKILQDNRSQDDKSRTDFRRKILIGEMFIRHFPIALEFTPGKTSNEDALNLKPLDDFMEALSECQQVFQAMEDAIIQSRQK